jgi:hypothetical protein
MATSFKNVLSSAIGTDPVIVYTSAGNARVTVIGISLANITTGFLSASITITDPTPGGTFTANTNITTVPVDTSKVLSNVNTFNNISVGATLTGTGLPSNTVVESFDAVAKTITMNNSATAVGTAVTVTFVSPVAATSYYIKNVIVPPNQSLRVINGGERLVLGSSNSLSIVTNAEVGSCNAIVSLVEIL